MKHESCKEQRDDGKRSMRHEISGQKGLIMMLGLEETMDPLAKVIGLCW